MIASSCRKKVVARAGSAASAGAWRHAGNIVRPLLMAAVLSGAYLPSVTRAQELSKPAAPMEARVKVLIPDLEAYIRSAMTAYDLPGLAIGIVTGDRLVYAKGFGVRSKAGGAPVDTRTAFQIGSLTKGFLATTIAIMVDRGKVHWDDRVVDLYPAFQLQDAWVTREFRIFDLMAQRSGLRPLVNDVVGLLGYAEPAMIRSLRYVEPVSSFRTTFAYTNVTHLLAGRIVASLGGAPDWNAVAQRELLDLLGMAETSFTAEAMKAAANRAEGCRWTPDGTIEVPFEPLFPYGLGAAGNVNSTLEDMARWVRLHLGNGSFEGRRIVSPDSLAYTRLPKVAVEDKVSYAMGWYVARTRNGSIVWHDGDTNSFGAFVGMLPDRDVGVIVLTNEGNRGLPVGIGTWALDRLLDNPAVDYIADTLKQAKSEFASFEKLFAKPANPRPFPVLVPLAGSVAGPVFGKGVLRPEGEALVLELKDTGAELALAPWDGDVFTFRMLPRGRFAPMLANMGDRLRGFAQFESGKDGKLGVLRLTFAADGQAYEFSRD
jgi:CubicO group peptidase (beta-lactamase class C family)